MMTKFEICRKHKPIARWLIWGVLRIHWIDYGLQNHLYCSFGDGYETSYHKLTIHSSERKGDYIIFKNRRFYLDEAMRD